MNRTTSGPFATANLSITKQHVIIPQFDSIRSPAGAELTPTNKKTMITDEQLQDIAMQHDNGDSVGNPLLKKWHDQFDAAMLQVQDIVKYLETSSAAHYTIVSRDPSELLWFLSFTLYVVAFHNISIRLQKCSK